MGYLSPSLPARQSPHWRCRDCCRTRSWAWWWICAGGGLGGSSGHDGELVRGWRPAVPPPPGTTSTAISPGTAVPALTVPAVDVPTVALQLGAVCFGPRDTRHVPAAAGSMRKMLLQGFGLFGLFFLLFFFPQSQRATKSAPGSIPALRCVPLSWWLRWSWGSEVGAAQHSTTVLPRAQHRGARHGWREAPGGVFWWRCRIRALHALLSTFGSSPLCGDRRDITRAPSSVPGSEIHLCAAPRSAPVLIAAQPFSSRS